MPIFRRRLMSSQKLLNRSRGPCAVIAPALPLADTHAEGGEDDEGGERHHHAVADQHTELPDVFGALVRVATGLPFWDTQCGFKAFRMEACRPIIEAAKIIGFGFDVELLLLAQRAGLRLREIPVRWNHHEGSKVRFVHDSVRMLREVLSLRANNAVISKAESFTGEKPDSR